MQSGRLLIIHNPQAGALRPEEQQLGSRSIIADIRKAVGQRHEWVETRSAPEARGIARTASREGFEAIVAVGGDGTVHEVIEGVMELSHSLRPAIGILPTGSGNDLAFALGLPMDIRNALDVILRRTTRSIDIGCVRDDLGRSAIFDNSLGIGFDALVTMEAQRIRKLRGFARYFAATLTTIARHHRPFDVVLEIDRLRLHERALMLTIGNGPREGGGFVTTPGSVVDDGLFELLMIKPISRPMMLALLPKVLKGTHLRSSAIYARSFQHLHLQSAEPLAIHLDGEIFGDQNHPVTELDVTLEHRAIRVFV